MLGSASVHTALHVLLLSLLQSLVHCDDAISDRIPAMSRTRVPTGRNATIYFPCAKDRGKPQEFISIASDVCISWSSSNLDKDVLIQYPGLCEGTGKTPYVAVYSSSDCTGEHGHPGWYNTDRYGRPYGMIMPQCLSRALWPAPQAVTAGEEFRSMILRCGDPDAQGADEIQTISRPVPASKPTPSSKTPQPTTASVSDSACYVRELGENPRFLFQHPRADLCLNIKPKRQLKVYHTAICANGTKALFARFAGANCRGAPSLLTEVTSETFEKNGQAACIDMHNADDWSSYTFWCTGELAAAQTPQYELFSDKSEGQVRLHACFGSACGTPKLEEGKPHLSAVVKRMNPALRWLFFIGLFVVPVLVLVVLWFFIAALINGSFASLFQRIKGFFRKDGAIALK